MEGPNPSSQLIFWSNPSPSQVFSNPSYLCGDRQYNVCSLIYRTVGAEKKKLRWNFFSKSQLIQCGQIPVSS